MSNARNFGIEWAQSVIDSAYALVFFDETTVFTATATATLESAVGLRGKRRKFINGGTGVGTIATTSSQTIGESGATSWILAYRGDEIEVESDNANWRIISLSSTGGSRLLYAQTSIQSGDTIANTTVETNFASSVSIKANTPKVGQVIHVRARGHYSTDAVTAGNITIKLKAGTTVLIATNAIANIVSLSNRGWILDADLTVISIGAGGTIEAQGYVALSTAANTASVADADNTTVISLDTTVDQTLQVSVTWSAASTSNTIKQRSFVAEVMG